MKIRKKQTNKLALFILIGIIVFSTMSVYAEEPPEQIEEFDDKNIIQLKITKQPLKLNYLEGDYFDPLGMEITLTDINNLTKLITHYDLKDYDIKITPNVALKTTDTIIEIYKNDVKDYFKITVTKNIVNKQILEMIKDIAISLDIKNKTEASIEELNKAIRYAEDVLRYSSSTEREIQTAINDLKKAITSLRDIDLSNNDFLLSINSLKLGDNIIEGRTEPYYEVSVKINRNRSKIVDADRRGDFIVNITELKEGDKVEITVTNDKNKKSYKTLEVNITKDGSTTKEVVKTEESKEIENAIKFLEEQYTLGNKNILNPNSINTSTNSIFDLFFNMPNVTNMQVDKNILSRTFTNGINSYTEQFNGKIREFTMDIEPIMRNGELMVPLRYVAYSLETQVYYKADTNEIFLYNNGRTVYIDAKTGLAKDSLGKVFVVDKPLILNKRVLIKATDIPTIFNYYNLELYNDTLIIYKN